MTQRGHIQRYYRQRFAELHTRKLRVNSHRRIRIDITERFGIVWSPTSRKWICVAADHCNTEAIGRAIEATEFAPPASPGDTFRFVTRIKTVNRLRKMAKR